MGLVRECHIPLALAVRTITRVVPADITSSPRALEPDKIITFRQGLELDNIIASRQVLELDDLITFLQVLDTNGPITFLQALDTKGPTTFLPEPAFLTTASPTIVLLLPATFSLSDPPQRPCPKVLRQRHCW